MVDEKLANAVVRSLSEYLIDKRNSAVWDARRENLLGQVETKLSHHFGMEMVARFRDKPEDNTEANTLRLHLVRAIAEDPDFGRQLASTFGGKMARSARRRWRTAAAAIVAVAALGGAYVVGRVTAPDQNPQAVPATVTSTVEHTVTESEIASSTTESSNGTSSPAGSASPEIAGDGSSLAEGTPVFLTTLPRPNDNWVFSYGDHDVQFTQYSDSLWQTLNTCSASAQSYEQQFRLKNFSRIEVKAVGTDSEAATGLIVRFEVFVNNNAVSPVTSIEVAPGDAKELKGDLPPDTFSLTLRMSVARKDTQNCQRGNAVWGSPFVVAAGN